MKTLPLLEFASELYPEMDLEDVLVIGCQHILISKYELFCTLFKRGLQPRNVYLLGKCYSTSPVVYHKLERAGVRVSPLSREFKSHLSFDSQFADYVQHFLKPLLNPGKIRNFKKIIILDDGGLLLATANDLLSRVTNVVGIEQTSSGYTRLLNVPLRFPVINVARSKAKLQFESPLIAEAVMAELQRFLRRSKKRMQRILVVGQGPIGKNVCRVLGKSYKVYCYDMLTHRNEFPGAFTHKLKGYDMIIAATGKTILQPGHFELLKPGVVLVSVSSSDREFTAEYIRGQFPQTSNTHKNFTTKHTVLVNAGFPINFTGKQYGVKGPRIHLTESLFVAGVGEAMRGQLAPGLHDVNHIAQNKVIAKYKSLYT
jgi:S-adenosylhomocysteine hydrolase